MIEIKEMLIPINYNRRPNIKMTPTEICIHSTGNANSTAINERNWLVNPDNHRVASWHLCIDETNCILAIPLDEVAWHSGDTYGNNHAIGIEICESGNRQKTLARAIELTLQLMKQYNIPFNKVKRHFDYSGKNCPCILNQNGTWQGWKDFKSQLGNSVSPKDEPIDDLQLSEAVRTIIKQKKIYIDYNSWKRTDLIKLKNVPILLDKLGGVDKLIQTGVISNADIWKQGKYTVDNVRSLLIKYSKGH